MPNKLLTQPSNLVAKYCFLVQLLIAEFR